MNDNVILTFSPDGGQSVYTFIPGGKIVTFALIAFTTLIVLVALALVQLAQLASGLVTFLLTAPEPTLVRMAAYILSLIIVLVGIQWMKYRSAIKKVSSGVGAI